MFQGDKGAPGDEGDGGSPGAGGALGMERWSGGRRSGLGLGLCLSRPEAPVPCGGPGTAPLCSTLPPLPLEMPLEMPLETPLEVPPAAASHRAWGGGGARGCVPQEIFRGLEGPGKSEEEKKTQQHTGNAPCAAGAVLEKGAGGRACVAVRAPFAICRLPRGAPARGLWITKVSEN